MAWTTPRTWATNELVTAALMNTHVRDNLKHYGDTRYLPIPLNSAYYDSGTMSGFLASATIGVAKDDGIGATGLTYFPLQSIVFPDSGITGVAFNFHVPRDYGGSPVLKFILYNDSLSSLSLKAASFTAYIGAISGKVTINGNSLGTNTAAQVAVTVGGYQTFDSTAEITCTNAGGLAANTSAALYLVRTPAAAADDCGVDVGVIDIWLEYSVAA